MKNDEKIEFADKFLETYLSLGLGGVSKSEIDILVFHLLSQTDEFKRMNNYKMASALRITESRVKNLKMSAALKYREINAKAVLGEIVLRTMDGAQPLDIRSGRIELALEDPIEKRELEYYLKSKSHSAEYTLNSEVLRIEPIRLLELMIDNLEGADRVFDDVVKAALADQSASAKVIGGSSSITKKLAKLRSLEQDSQTVVRICKQLASALSLA